MSDFVPTSQADTRPFNKVLAVIPIGVAVLAGLCGLVDLLTGARYF